MEYLYLLICIAILPAENVLKKVAGKRCPYGSTFFTMLMALSSAALFTVIALCQGGFSYEWAVLPYSAAFGIGYAVCVLMGVWAFSLGSMALTALIISYSLMIPTLYGIIFKSEPAGALKIVGLALLAVSLFLVNAPSKKAADGTEKTVNFSFKWLVCAFLAFAINGAISIVQAEQQLRFNKGYRSEFMVVALVMGALCLLPLAIKKEGAHVKECLRMSAPHAVACGVLNGVLNLLVMVTTLMIPKSLFFPLLSGGSMIASYLISVFVYKERFTWVQNTGILCGVASLILLNL